MAWQPPLTSDHWWRHGATINFKIRHFHKLFKIMIRHAFLNTVKFVSAKIAIDPTKLLKIDWEGSKQLQADGYDIILDIQKSEKP